MMFPYDIDRAGLWAVLSFLFGKGHLRTDPQAVQLASCSIKSLSDLRIEFLLRLPVNHKLFSGYTRFDRYVIQ